MKLPIINYFTFQAGWFACVLSAAAGRPSTGLLAALILLALHLSLASKAWPEVKLVLACGFIGLAFESLLLSSGWVSYPNGGWLPGMAPYWMVAMWLLFATTLNLSLRWLKGRPLLAAVLGATGGPLSYLAGQELGAMRLENPSAALAAIGLAWAFITPLLCLLAQRWNGFPSEDKAWPVVTGWSRAGAEDHA